MNRIRIAGGCAHRRNGHTTIHTTTTDGTATIRIAPTTGATMHDDLYALAAALFDPDGEPAPAPRDDDQPIAA
jgi:hypothetical protein